MDDFDVAIIGGGSAGAADQAKFLATYGRDVLPRIRNEARSALERRDASRKVA